MPEHPPVAETFPEKIRARLREMRGVAQPYLDRIVGELDAQPKVPLDRLPGVQAAMGLEDEDTQVAVFAAVLEQHLDTDDPKWRSLMSMLYGRILRRDVEMAQWLHEHPVVSRLWEEENERRKQQFDEYAERRADDQASRRTKPLPPELDQLLQRHRAVAEPWLERIEARSRAVDAVWSEYRDALTGHDHFDLEQRLEEASGGDRKDIAREIVRELQAGPGSVQVSVALVWLFDQLNERARSHHPGTALWARLNRRALPYEPEDLELALDLVVGRQYGWVWASPLVRAIDRFVAAGGAVRDEWHDPLRALLADSAGARRAEDQKMAVTLRSLLGTAPASATRLDASPLDGADAWSTTARERLEERYGDDGSLNGLISVIQASGTAPRPSAAWRRRAAVALAASTSAQDAVHALLETAVEVRDELVRRTDDGTWLYSALGEPAALQIRAAAWAAQLSGASWAPDLLEQLARRYSELLFNGEPHSARVANGAVSALALGDSRDSVVRLARLQRVMWHGAMRKHLERELDVLAREAGLTRGQLLELSAPDLGLGDDGTSTLAVEDAGSLELSLDERCRLVTRWSLAGSATGRASPPRELREAAPERVEELHRHVKQARASLAAERERVDAMLAEQPRWRLEDWSVSYARHPVLRALGRTLVWNVDLGDAVRAGMPGDEAGAFVDLDGAAFVASGEAELTLWHPIAATESDVAAWRSALFERRIAQPVRQVFREVYRPTSEERGATHSTRFAGQLLEQRPLRGLLKRRGWSAPALLTWDVGGPEAAVAARDFAGFGVRAELSYAPEWTKEALDGIPGGYQLVSTGRLQFSPAGAKDASPLPLADVPELVVSEAMRDVDLFVSVCSVALDPSWRDFGETGLHREWRELAFGELVESARIRRELLEHALPELSIADRAALYERDLVVRGVRATYRIHIGTGQVRVDPHGSPLVVPRTRAGAGELARLFLPVEADDTLAVVLGTAFLLANDDAIADDGFLSQLPADAR